MPFVVSKNSPHTRPCQSINYQLRGHCCVLSRSGTRTRQTVVTFLGRSFLKEQKQIRVTSCERPWYNTRSTADTFTKVIVSQLHAALWCFARRMLLAGRARWTYAEHTEAAYAWPWLLLSIRVWVSEQNTDAHPSWTHPTLHTSQHLNVHLHQNDVWEQGE